MAVFSRAGRHRGTADVMAVVRKEAQDAAQAHFVSTLLPQLLDAVEAGFPPQFEGAPPVVSRAANLVLAFADRSRRQAAQDTAAAVRPVLEQINRQGRELAAAQRSVVDADSMAALYRADHANALAARFAVRLTVLAGGLWPAPRPQPATLAEVGQAAQGQVADYERVQAGGTADLTVVPEAVVPVVAALAELLDNALSHGGPQAQVVLECSAQPGSGATWLVVTDTGPGMSEATLAAVRRVLDGGGRVPAGTPWSGHGMRLVAAAAQLVGLRAAVNSAPGRTTAGVLLPPELLVPPPAPAGSVLRRLQ
ncbi:ATP-binding protein [Streptomyces sp. CBMA156]|uniref:ATP-binding protein n=1 Tax=Streptomyces sp. CBMA156 TaxID=1930280 RepID=UPI0016618C0A|nr:ATP-binding protein [Streptomyces sp. CBMA156]MBD0670403.1 hypothetical protein [Streptomyces sp. CBMA156]